MESARRQQHAISARGSDMTEPVYRLRTLGELRLDGPHGEVRELRRKERLLLAYLARAPGPVPRSALVALLWGGQPESNARHALRQALCAVRKALPGVVIATPAAASLARGVVELDVAALERDVRLGRPADAVARWGGEFLADHDDAGDEPFREWIGGERAALARLMSAALDDLARGARDAAAIDAALGPIRRWAEQHPWDEAAQVRLVALLRAGGRQAEAAGCHARSTERLRDELGRPPSAGFAGMAGALTAVVPAMADASSVAALVAAWERVRAGGSGVLVLEGAADRIAAACEELAGAAAARSLPAGAAAPQLFHASGDAGQATGADVARPVLARLLAPVRHARGVSAVPDDALAEVATLVPSLRARYPALPAAVGGTARLTAAVLDTLAEIALEAPTLLLVEDAPRADAGSREILAAIAAAPPSGALLVLTGSAAGFAADPQLAPFLAAGTAAPADEPPLDPQVAAPAQAAPWSDATARTTAASTPPRMPAPPPTGRLRGWPPSRGSRALALALLLGVAAAGFARSARTTVPGADDATGGANAAARVYVDAGLEALQERRDPAAALRLFSAALARDPDFALAAYYAGMAAGEVSGHAAAAVFFQRARALAPRAPDAERLLVLTGSALQLNDPASTAQANALTLRYPDEPAGVMLLAAALLQEGRFLEAVRQYRRVLAMHDPAEPIAGGACATCDARRHIAMAYWMADSADAAIRATSDWAAAEPGQAAPFALLAEYLAAIARYDDADDAARRAAALGDRAGADVFASAARGVRTRDFATVDPALAWLAASHDAELARRAAWLQSISFRHQRRWAEAWTAATAYRELTRPGRPAEHPFATPQAVVLLESGRPLRAAAMFDTMYQRVGDLGSPSRTARDLAWLLTLRASALAAAGDTTRLASLADSIRELGLRSSYGRDRRLHHHVRGLLLTARADLDGAAREFRLAIYSPVVGYTRTNAHLADVLIRAGRASEALAPLRSALRAPLDGPALYVTRTELYELAGRAFAAAGMPDSAAHYRRLAAPPAPALPAAPLAPPAARAIARH